MFALTILYTVLFVYLYFRSRKFKTSHSSDLGTGTERTTGVELPGWQATAGGNTGVPCPDPQTFLRTQSVTMVSESYTRRVRTRENDSRRRMSKAAVTLLYYPVVYICLTMPCPFKRSLDWLNLLVKIGVLLPLSSAQTFTFVQDGSTSSCARQLERGSSRGIGLFLRGRDPFL